MPSIAKSLKVARLAVQHLGPPLARAVVTLAGGVVANFAANATRPRAGCGDSWLMMTKEDEIAGRQPGDLYFGTNYLPPYLEENDLAWY